MVAGQEIHNGLFLMRPRLDAFDLFHPAEEPFVDIIGRKIPLALVAVPFGSQTPQGTIFLLVSHNVPVYPAACSSGANHPPPLRSTSRQREEHSRQSATDLVGVDFRFERRPSHIHILQRGAQQLGNHGA